MGGEGHEPELDLLRDGKITAVNIFAVGLGRMGGDRHDEQRLSQDSARRQRARLGDGRRRAQRARLGPVRPAIDYRSQYRKAWAVS